MNLNITGHQLSITKSLKDYINQRFLKIQRHFCNNLDVHMVLEVKKLVNKVEITTRLPGKDLHVEVEDSNLLVSINFTIISPCIYGGVGNRKSFEERVL